MKKMHLSNSVKGLLLVLLAAVVLEGLFDWMEIGVGELMRFINPLRPRIGRLWEEEAKDRSGGEQIAEFLQSLPIDSSKQGTQLADLGDLLGSLSIRSRLSINRNEFLSFYRRLEPYEARLLVEAKDLYALYRNPDWQRVSLTLEADQLALLFTDGFNRLLHEHYVPVDSLQRQSPLSSGMSQLSRDDRFAGRIVPAAVFFRAFDRLSSQQQQNLIPDLYRLIEWGSDLKAVAISRIVRAKKVDLAFEVKRGDLLKIVVMETDADAVSYLITKLNAMGESAPLMMPIEKGP
ncbi:hypothetical protein JW992_10095 [candidate division KSB1 bacterium]|nr:hypothetical protein [candidate division KSB1 bacterium]